MPAKSSEQKRLMDAAAHNPAFAKKVGIPVSVAQEFSKASKGQTFGNGTRPSQQGVNQPKTNHGDSALFAKGGTMKESKAMEMRHVAAMKKAGVPKNIVREEAAEAAAMKNGGKAKRMAFGGSAEMTGRDRAAQMSGRTMPNGGRPASTGLARAAEMSGRTMPTTGRPAMKSGGGVKKMAIGGATAPAGLPTQANFGGASTGLDRAAAMSGRTMPAGGAPTSSPAVMPAVPSIPNRVALPATAQGPAMKKGGKTKAACYARGGGIEVKGKTKGRMV